MIKLKTLGELALNSSNPRIFKDEDTQKVVKSLCEFPQMLYLRPVVTDGGNVVLGGNL